MFIKSFSQVKCQVLRPKFSHSLRWWFTEQMFEQMLMGDDVGVRHGAHHSSKPRKCLRNVVWQHCPVFHQPQDSHVWWNVRFLLQCDININTVSPVIINRWGKLYHVKIKIPAVCRDLLLSNIITNNQTVFILVLIRQTLMTFFIIKF